MKDETVFDPVTGKHLKSSSLARREKRAAFRAVKDRAKNEQAERLRKQPTRTPNVFTVSESR